MRLIKHLPSDRATVDARMTVTAKRDAVIKSPSQLWMFSKRLHVMRVKSARLLDAAMLARVIVSLFNVTRKPSAECASARGSLPVFPLVVGRSSKGRVLCEDDRQFTSGLSRDSLADVGSRDCRSMLWCLYGAALVMPLDVAQWFPGHVSVPRGVPLWYARWMAASALAVAVWYGFIVRHGGDGYFTATGRA